MTGTLINVVAIIVGSLIGLVLKKGFNEKIEKVVFRLLGIGVVIIGVSSLLSTMFRVEDGAIKSSGDLMLLVSLVVGGVIGEFLKIDERLNNLGKKLESKMKGEGFAKGFITASVMYCVGAMAIVGSLNDGLVGDYSILATKSIMDFISSIILASSLGIGVMFSFIPVLIYQGAISLLSTVLSPILTAEILTCLCTVGYGIIICLGLNFVLDDFEVKTANLLPALVVGIIYQLISTLV